MLVFTGKIINNISNTSQQIKIESWNLHTRSRKNYSLMYIKNQTCIHWGKQTKYERFLSSYLLIHFMSRSFFFPIFCIAYSVCIYKKPFLSLSLCYASISFLAHLFKSSSAYASVRTHTPLFHIPSCFSFICPLYHQGCSFLLAAYLVKSRSSP